MLLFDLLLSADNTTEVHVKQGDNVILSVNQPRTNFGTLARDILDSHIVTIIPENYREMTAIIKLSNGE